MGEKLLQIFGIIVAVVFAGLILIYFTTATRAFSEQKSIGDRHGRLSLPYDISIFDGTELTRNSVLSLMNETNIPLALVIDEPPMAGEIIEDGTPITYSCELETNDNGVYTTVRLNVEKRSGEE